MTTPLRDEVLAHFLDTLRSMTDEWADKVDLTEDSLIMGDMNWRSIEIVYLANALQLHYGRVFPFESLLRRVEQREQKDISVREWVDFIVAELQRPPEGADDARAGGASASPTPST